MNMTNDMALIAQLARSAPQMQRALEQIEQATAEKKGCDTGVLEEVVSHVHKLALFCVNKRQPPAPLPLTPAVRQAPAPLSPAQHGPALDTLLDCVQDLANEERKFGGSDTAAVCEAFAAYKLALAKAGVQQTTSTDSQPIAAGVGRVSITLEVDYKLNGASAEDMAETLRSAIENEINNTSLLQPDDDSDATVESSTLTSKVVGQGARKLTM
jgi:hypothetical protein